MMKKLKINKKETEILYQYYVLVDGEYGSPDTVIECDLIEKLRNYIKKN